MDASKGLRAMTLAILLILSAAVLACTDPAAGASPSGQPATVAPAPTDAPVDASSDEPSDAPSAPSGPDDYEY